MVTAVEFMANLPKKLDKSLILSEVSIDKNKIMARDKLDSSHLKIVRETMDSYMEELFGIMRDVNIQILDQAIVFNTPCDHMKFLFQEANRIQQEAIKRFTNKEV